MSCHAGRPFTDVPWIEGARVAAWGQHAGAFTDEVEEQMQHTVDRRSRRVGSGRRAFGVLALGVGVVGASACGTTTEVDVAAPGTSVASLTPTRPPVGSAPSTTVVDCDDVDQLALVERQYRQLPGVSPALLSLDVYGPLPPEGCPPVPIVVDIHGGDFARGDKSDHLHQKVGVFNAAGYALVSINHRLLGDDRSGPGGGAYPAPTDDVAAAIRWVVDNASNFSGDAGRIALVGSGSGAFLAAQQITEPAHLAAAGVVPTAVRCAALIDPAPLDVPAQIDAGGRQADRYRELFGDDPDVWRDASPQQAAQDGAVSADVLIVTRGPEQRTANATWFAGTLEAAGAEVAQLDADPLSDDLEARIGRTDDTTLTPVLLGFLDRCLD